MSYKSEASRGYISEYPYDLLGDKEKTAMNAFIKLIVLRDVWRGSYYIGKDNDTSICNSKYSNGSEIIMLSKMYDYPQRHSLLRFHDGKMANEFLETFRDLIEHAKMFL